ncbi:Leucine-rich repeat-containing protein 23, partial [Coelomomyces lativittatus]
NKLTQLSIEDAPHLNQLEVRGNQLNTLHLLQLPKLDKLYLGGNQLTDLQFLRNKPSLTLLHLRDNKLRSLPINLDENLSLIYLNLRNNQIESFSELEKLKSFIHLSKLVLLENPCCEQPNYRSNVIYRLPQLKTLDKESIRDEEREEAEKLRLEIERMEQERCRKEKEDAEALRKQQEKEETPVEEASEASKQDEINQNAETQEQGEKEEEKEEKEEEEEEEDDNDDLEDEV